MNKELKTYGVGTTFEEMIDYVKNMKNIDENEANNILDEFLQNSLKEKEKNEFELEVFKLAYEWKCNGVEGTYEEVLDQARKTVKGWKEIERIGYGTIITE